MVIVRESAHANLSPTKDPTQWPPKSPFQALLSSPSGRRKWQQVKARSDQRSPSPSPLRKPMASSKALQAMPGAEDGEGDDEEEEEEEDDEETLQLRLQALQTKLKLRKLRQTKSKGGGGSGSGSGSGRSPGRSPLASSASAPPLHRAEVEVELSPSKARQPPVSPARARLGLLTARKAQDVSLKRARDGTHIKRSLPGGGMHVDTPKPKSFSERLRDGQAKEQDHRAKAERIERSRSKGFALGNGITSSLQPTEPSVPQSMIGQRRHHRLEAPRSEHSANRPDRPRKEPTPACTSSTRSSHVLTSSHPRSPERASSQSSFDKWQKGNPAPSEDPSSPFPPRSNTPQDPTAYDSFSTLHLRKRHIPHPHVACALQNSEIYTLPRLLKEVKAPHYDPPNCEEDYVVFAVLASKSTPLDHKPLHRTSDENKPQHDPAAPRNKFMVLHLTDLEWEVDCFLFGAAFDAFWKLTPGTLLAILNPAIMPPKTNQHNGKFCLKLASGEDGVMEVGVARDLGWCVSVKKDGQQCGAWVDRRKTEVCEFHINQLIERSRKGRMEVNTMWRSHAGGGGEMPSSMGHGEKKGLSWQQKAEKRREVREYGQLYSVPSGLGKSASELLDREDSDALHGMTREEASRKRIAAAQRERDLAKRMGQIGNGVGAEYLRHGTQPSTTSAHMDSRAGSKHGCGTADASDGFVKKPTAAQLGLLGKKASDQRLSPLQGRKRHFGVAALTSAGREARGWGGARTWGLLLPAEPGKKAGLGSPERGQTGLEGGGVGRPSLVRGGMRKGEGQGSPSKKKAGFRLEGKGLREPGRESLGEDLKMSHCGVGGDEESELDIV